MIPNGLAPVLDRFVEDTAAQLPAAHRPQRLIWFRFYFDDGRCEWSPQILQMYGYPPAAAATGIDLALLRVHPGDYDRVAAIVDNIRRTRQRFNSRHRIVDNGCRVHDVVVLGAPFYEGPGEPVGMQGFCVDVTPGKAIAATAAHQHAYERLADCLPTAPCDSDDHDRRRRIRAATRC